ncbi:tripartite tricarboxylate transporter permease [Acuticoccus mangrovi]|uniref:Tripartite tricarboxylate transporter permease n=1 Tax=Acuticoccus mangrovi TaxID=2796142 RepID=A0A934MG56_9HYPH|nr:tripartite tricarboxylate transporter permease [Acuticoccus mangrovi]MBJ3775615.1 tripartite tricarboxylate transporter permease [Acuticoccus mangrovi]
MLDILLTLLRPDTLLAMVGGTALGVVVGAIPGLGSILGLSVVLPFTFGMDALPSIVLLIGVYAGSVYGGSVSAILINMPGTPQSAATSLDGYPMAVGGQPGLAIGWATLASLVGGTFSAVVLMLIAAPVATFSLRFGPPEFFALTLMALTCVVAVSRGSVIKGLIAAVVGLFVAVVGSDPMTGDLRFDFGVLELSGGVNRVAVLIGLFALSEVFMQARSVDTPTAVDTSALAFRLPPWSAVAARLKTLLKSCLIGTGIGILPGTGATAASFISYVEAKRSGRFRANFGKGEPEGIIASEAANNAVTGGALVPSLALGIPGDAVTALIVSLLIVKGVQPGPFLFMRDPGFIHSLFAAFIIINILMALIGAALTGVFARILAVPTAILLGAITLFSMIGAYSLAGSGADVITCLVAGVVGFVLRLAGVPLAALAIGLVLGPLVEESLRQSLIMTDGSFVAIFLRPYSGAVLVLTVALLAAVTLGNRGERPQRTTDEVA